MEISFGSKIPAVSGAVQSRPARTASVPGRQENAARRFDSITIGSARTGNSSYAMALKSRLTQEVRTSATPGRLSALRQQVQDGTYQPDPTSIARRMLLMAEEA